MTHYENKAIVLARHPEGPLQLSEFRMEITPVRDLEPGEFLIANQWLSLDPYIRLRLNLSTDYVNSIHCGDVIAGETVGVVVASRNPNFNEGSKVFVYSGWQQYYISNERDFIVHTLPQVELSDTIFLNTVGTPGRAAYFGMIRIAKPRAGETLVVSAASGAVGSTVGQIGKMAGCRVVGIAGSEEKCRYVVHELGFDFCVNYRDSDFKHQLRQACPNGIDIYFENVGGRISVLVAQLLNDGARVPVCGNAANYDQSSSIAASSPADFFSSLPNPPVNRFFLVTEWFKDYPESDEWLLNALHEGKLKYRETLIDGLEKAPQAFIDLLNARHFGKQIVKIS
ncbi:NADP-dependent oxidoreductase [Xenorhabdus griffiniae]|uniref:NADP-dependent oxidoreductase n=1 Tax=Xenorhabdus griffiniae TaxID=351672 RepID=UPI002359BA9A|nr:NADP-dependent oxidoreductase [Xenorhabdus griffiniae]MDC9606051.1 NADP-dependent oxidoreductase [Xenorhabdus griffiniae]